MNHRHIARLSSIALATLLAGCQTDRSTSTGSIDSSATPAVAGGAPGSTSKQPLFAGLGDHHRAVTTSSKEAQKYFDQGLVWTFAFNHDEAIRSFQQVAALDPDCAMAWWGIALCNGPHINNAAMDAAHVAAAWEALQKARSLREHASPAEQALIDALAHRYSSDPASPRGPLDKAYADAMAGVHQTFPKDDDIAVLYAESLMDLRPWDLWSHDGQPRPETPMVLATLESVLKSDPKHPGANHLYIHAVEASPDPARALPAANRLRTLVPGSGHLVHMPAHIDIRTGRWDLAAQQNVQASEIDRTYRAISPRQGFYHIYMAHNHQFLAFADMMRGRRASAMQAMRDMIAGVPQEFIDNMGPAIDGYLGIQYECPMRFGMWDEILQAPEPPSQLPITTAMRLFARSVAYAAKGDVNAALAEQATFRKAVDDVPQGAKMAINDAHTVLKLADHVITGEIAYRKGDFDKAVNELSAGVKIEDSLLYMEPPDWLVPARHALGAILVERKRWTEAEAVYRADLKYWPENGWSLYGLWQCLEASKSPEAKSVKARFDKVWEGSDTPLTTTCLCVQKK